MLLDEKMFKFGGYGLLLAVYTFTFKQWIMDNDCICLVSRSMTGGGIYGGNIGK